MQVQTLFYNLQGHIFLLQGHKVCQKTRYFNAHLMPILNPILITN